MDQNLEPNYRPRNYCTCPKVAKPSDIQVIQDVLARHLEQMDNPSTHDSQDRPLNQVGGNHIIQIGVVMKTAKTIRPGLP